MQKYSKNKKVNEKDRQTTKSFDKLYRKSLEDNVIDKNEYEFFWNNFTKDLDEAKIEPFFKQEYKNMSELF